MDQFHVCPVCPRMFFTKICFEFHCAGAHPQIPDNEEKSVPAGVEPPSHRPDQPPSDHRAQVELTTLIEGDREKGPSGRKRGLNHGSSGSSGSSGNNGSSSSSGSCEYVTEIGLRSCEKISVFVKYPSS